MVWIEFEADTKEEAHDRYAHAIHKNPDVSLVWTAQSVWFKYLTKTIKVKGTIGTKRKDFLGITEVGLLPPLALFLHDPVGWLGKAKPVLVPVSQAIHGQWDESWLHKDLSLDLETTGLNPLKDSIISFSLALDTENAISLEFKRHEEILERVLKEGTGKLIAHNAAFDFSFLVQTFFDSWKEAYACLYPRIHDTKLMAWLALNSVIRPDLSLKSLAFSFLGDWGKDIKHTGIVTQELLDYGLKDAQAVWYLYSLYGSESSSKLYVNLLRPSLWDIIQMQLTGLPVAIERVLEEEEAMNLIQDELMKRIQSDPLVKSYARGKKQEWVELRNSTLKKKRVTYEDAEFEFNPGSQKHLTELLCDQAGLTPVAYTEKGLPSMRKDHLKKMGEQGCSDLIRKITEHAENRKMLNTYFPLLKATGTKEIRGKEYRFLTGHYNLGGTVTGRLSSQNPNLQNLPATGTVHAERFKRLFKPPPGWWLVGMDFDSLEDKISALLTKDPNKLKVYTEGYDGHSLRAYQYFKDQMPDIEQTVSSINSIKDRYPDLRQLSKGPTFALTYQGSWKALANVCGLSEEDAKRIEKAYHEMYSVSDQWVQDQLEKAWETGYVTGAFGLKIHTPLMGNLLNTGSKGEVLQQERRTAGNALGQSWCLLNSRACNEVMEEVRKADLWRDVYPCAQIHDASYFLIRKDIDLLWWWIQKMERAASWQEAEEIQHDEVKLSGTCVLYEPDWANEIKLAHLQSIDELKEVLDGHRIDI